MANFQPGTIFHGDNLEIMRGMDSGTITLVYLDPPFCSQKDYEAGNGAFGDRWSSDDIREADLERISNSHTEVSEFINLTAKLGSKAMHAYLIFMAVRLMELHRLLDEQGSLFLHVDPVSSHYLKIILDGIFGGSNFRNEIVWHYNKWTNAAKHFQKNHDVILYYGKTDRVKFNPQYVMTDIKQGLLDKGYKYNTAKLESGSVRQLLVYDREKAATEIANGDYERLVYRDDANPGVLKADVWNDIPYLRWQEKERVDYPTQKPMKLLEVIVNAATDENDMVLDPFCGSGTTLAVADRLHRQWVGIDESDDAVRTAAERIRKENPKRGGLFSGNDDEWKCEVNKGIPIRTNEEI